MQIRINKYILYSFLLLCVICYNYGVQFWCFLTYKQTRGIIKEFIYTEESYFFNRMIEKSPVVDFTVDGVNYSFIGSPNLYNFASDGSRVPILYNPKQPSKAYVFTYYGFWGDSFLIVFPLFVVLSMILLPVGMVPKIIVINEEKFKTYFNLKR